MLKAQNDLDGAIEAYQRALAFNPNLVEADAAIGEIQLEREEYIGAIVSFRRVINRSPGNANAHYNLGMAIKGRGGRDRQAIAALEKALELYEKQEDTEGVKKAQEALEELKK